MRKLRFSKVALPVAAVFILLIAWEISTNIFKIPIYVLPPPSKVGMAFIENWLVLVKHGVITLCETGIGLVFAVFVGIFLAVAMDAIPFLKTSLYPLFVVSQTIPIIVLAPIFIIYLGFGMMPKVLTVVLMCFFPIVVSFSDGLSQVDARQVNLVRSLGANTCQVYALVKIPAASVSLFSGLKVAATYSVSGAVVGEWLSSDSGLGYYMLRVKNAYMLDKVFASVLMVILLSLILNCGVRLVQIIMLPHMRNKTRR